MLGFLPPRDWNFSSLAFFACLCAPVAVFTAVWEVTGKESLSRQLGEVQFAFGLAMCLVSFQLGSWHPLGSSTRWDRWMAGVRKVLALGSLGWFGYEIFRASRFF